MQYYCSYVTTSYLATSYIQYTYMIALLATYILYQLYLLSAMFMYKEATQQCYTIIDHRIVERKKIANQPPQLNLIAVLHRKPAMQLHSYTYHIGRVPTMQPASQPASQIYVYSIQKQQSYIQLASSIYKNTQLQLQLQLLIASQLSYI